MKRWSSSFCILLILLLIFNSESSEASWGTGSVAVRRLDVFSGASGSNMNLCRVSKKNDKGESTKLNILERSKNRAWYKIDISKYKDCQAACLKSSKCKINCTQNENSSEDAPETAQCTAWVRAAHVKLVQSAHVKLVRPARSETVFEEKANFDEAKNTAAGLCKDCEQSSGSTLAQNIGEVKDAISEKVIEGYSKVKGVATLMFNAIKGSLSRSTGYCYRYVKRALLSSGLVSRYLPGASASKAGPELEKEGFVNLMKDSLTSINSPCDAPVGSVLVYSGGAHGHIEIKTESGCVSDYVSPNCRTGGCYLSGRGRSLTGVYVKPGGVVTFFDYLKKILHLHIFSRAYASEPDQVSGQYKTLEKIIAKYTEPTFQEDVSNSKDFKWMVEQMLNLLEKDPSNYAFELYYPVYVKFKPQTLQILLKQNLKVQELFKQAEKSYLRELKEGNG